MTNEDKRKLVEFVGLKWHQQTGLNSCACGREDLCMESHMYFTTTLHHNLDPLDPADMYGKIWVAFRKMGDDYDFETFLLVHHGSTIAIVLPILTSAPDLSQAMLEYIKEKENE